MLGTVFPDVEALADEVQPERAADHPLGRDPVDVMSGRTHEVTIAA